MSTATAPSAEHDDVRTLRMNEARGRWTLAVTVLASGIAFLDGSVVNIALQSMHTTFGIDLSGLQWVVDAYLLTLGSLLVLGGSLGDMYGRRRVLEYGILGFALASLACGAAPNGAVLIGARALQGVAGALLVPGSLAIISATFHPLDRGRAIGAWSGATSAVFVVGPVVGGVLVQLSWRWVFLINLPVAALTLVLSRLHVPETRDDSLLRRPDIAGALTISAGLAGTVYALIQGPAHGWTPSTVAAGVAGIIALAAFPFVERSVRSPMVPLRIFRSLQFSGANLVTLAVYAALGVSGFLGVTYYQGELGYAPVVASLALLPPTLLLIALSSRMGALTTRIGPRVPMTVGPLLIAAGMLWLSRVIDGTTYLAGILPGAMVFGLGLAITVAPLTTAVLASIAPRQSGVGAAINNAVARVASLLGIAVLPALAGWGSAQGPHHASYVHAYQWSMVGCAVLAVLGSVTAWITISAKRTAEPPVALAPEIAEETRA